MKIDYDNDHYIIDIPPVSWREMRAVVDWLDATEIESVVQTEGGVDLHRLYPEPRVHDLRVHFYSEHDAVLFKLKWTGALGKPRID